ncbi:MAG: AraC family transcriptional regulator [Paludibacteraceae bacterium]|nr:AraC family transcriptional regulator [Paludibacteraceae bacterium]
MDSLFLLQFGCFLSTTLMALLLAFARLHTSRINRGYEVSRWILFAAQLLFALHYLLQMVFGFRAHGADVGVVVNILFYTPISALIAFATIRLASSREHQKRQVVIGTISTIVVMVCFGLGYVMNGSLHMGRMTYVMECIYAISQIYFSISPINEMRRIFRQVESYTAGDISTSQMYMSVGVSLMAVLGCVMAVGLLSTSMLYYIGTAFMLTMYFYVVCFVELGSHMAALNEVLENNTDTNSETPDEVQTNTPENSLPEERVAEIEAKMANWRKERGYSDPDLNLNSLARRLQIPQKELARYLLQTQGKTFRIWLSDLRLEEVKRMLLTHDEYSIEAIAMECGFSSRSWLQHKFKTSTGMTVTEWKANHFTI